MLRALAGSVAFSGLAAVSSYVLTVLLARSAPSADFGLYALALGWAAIITTLVDCAADLAFSHYATRMADSQSAFNTIMTTRLVMTLAVLLLLIPLRLADLINMPWQTLLLLMPAFNMGIVFEYNRENARYAGIIFIEKLVLLVLNWVFIHIFLYNYVVYSTYFLVSLISLLIQISRYQNYIWNFRFVNVDPIAEYFMRYWPLLVITLSQLGYGHISRLIIEGKKGIETFAAVSLAFQFLTLASIFQSQVSRNFRPHFITAVRSGDATIAYMLIGKYILFTTLPLAFGGSILWALAPFLVRWIYGPQYDLAADVLRYLCPLFVTISLMRLGDILLLSLDKVRENLFLNSAVSFAMLVTMALLPASAPLVDFVMVVVVSQFGHICLSAWIISRAPEWKNA